MSNRNEIAELLEKLEEMAEAEYSDYELAKRARKALASLQSDERVEEVEPDIHSINATQPENGAQCLVWMGGWWRTVTYYSVTIKSPTGFYDADGEPLRKPVEYWLYSPDPEAKRIVQPTGSEK